MQQNSFHHMMHHYMLTVQFTGNLQQLWLYKVMMHNVLVGHHLQLIMLFTGVKVHFTGIMLFNKVMMHLHLDEIHLHLVVHFTGK